MNKKITLLLAIFLTLFLVGSVSAGFFDFLKFGDDSASSDVHVVEDGQYCTPNEVAAYIKEFQAITLPKAKPGIWDGKVDLLRNTLPEKA